MPEVNIFFVIGFTFLLAGLTKGIIGLGLPTISLAILTLFFGIKDAMPLIIIPSLVTNLMQACSGPHFRDIIVRFRFLLLFGVIGILGVSEIFVNSNNKDLAMILGISIAIHACLGLSPIRKPDLIKQEKWLSPIIGVFTGIFTGLSGSFVMPAVAYFQSLGLQRDYFIQAMGVWFSVATAGLALMLGIKGFLAMDLNIASTAGLLPALLGMSAGQVIRRKISEMHSRKIFFLVLLFIGVYIIVGSF